MTQKHSPPQLTPREYKDGRGWYIEATSDVGITENLGDFKLTIGSFENRPLISKRGRNDTGTARRIGHEPSPLTAGDFVGPCRH